MKVRITPAAITKNPKRLGDIFNHDNNVYVIKADLQRKYCWKPAIIERLITEYYVDLYEGNQWAVEACEDYFYATIGDCCFSKRRKDWEGTGCNYQEIIDGSQRLTTIFSICMVSIYLYMERSGIFDIDERRRIMDSYVKTGKRQCFKLTTTFKDCEISEVYEKLVTREMDFKIIPTKNEERINYMPFSKLVSYIYKILSGMEKNGSLCEGVDFKGYLDSFLESTYLYVEECDIEDRLVKFKEMNSYHVGVADHDIYKSLLCDKGKEVIVKYQEFEKWIKKITSTTEISSKNRLHTNVSTTGIEYIMKLGLICYTLDEDICNVSYSLKEPIKGMEWQLNNEHGYLRSEENVHSFLDKCIDICKFLYGSTEYTDKFNESFYMFTEGYGHPYIWWHAILPCYLIKNIEDQKCKDFVFALLLKTYFLTTVLKATASTNKGKCLFNLCQILLNYAKNGWQYIPMSEELSRYYSQNFMSFIVSDKLSTTMDHICYAINGNKCAIHGTLSYFEFISQWFADRPSSNIWELLTAENAKSSKITIEHILPQANKNDTNSMHIDCLGNLVLLENNLNSSKQDDLESTSKCYKDSSFITTKLLISDSVFPGVCSDTLSKLKSDYLPMVYSENELNHFNEQMIVSRLKAIKALIRKTLQSIEVITHK